MRTLLLALFLLSTPALASSPADWDQSRKDAVAACLAASDLNSATVRGDPLILDDSAGKTAVLVRGRWKPAHMQGARATILCLYDRATKTAAVTEAKGWSAR